MLIATIAILIIIIITILLYDKFNENTIEHYDDRLANITLEKCAKFCERKAGCFGFAYDQRNNICYPSKSTLMGRPVNENTLVPTSIFRDDYSPDNAVCNKIGPIISPSKNPPFNERRMNSIFVCTEKEGKQPQWYLHHDGDKFENIGEGARIDELFDIDAYEVEPYNWPVSKFDAERTKYLVEQQQKNKLTKDTITNIARIEDPPIITESHPTPYEYNFIAPTKNQPLDFGFRTVSRLR